MTQLGFSDTEQDEVVQILAGVLHLGNIGFTETKSQVGDYAHQSTFLNVTRAKHPRIPSVSYVSVGHGKFACALVDADMFVLASLLDRCAYRRRCLPLKVTSRSTVLAASWASVRSGKAYTIP